MYDLLVIGGGAAGFFTAINVKLQRPEYKIVILEKNHEVLNKVRISGGGRCNLTHHCFDPEALVKFYPRGGDFLLEPFKVFNPKHTVEWFSQLGVDTKIEPDGRMFPTANSSSAVVDCFEDFCFKNGIEVKKRTKVSQIDKSTTGFIIKTDENSFETRNLMLATGSDLHIWKLLADWGIETVSPVPSLFSFKTDDAALHALAGLSLPSTQVKTGNIHTEGGLLITHWGLSGPAVLKASAWAAPELNRDNYASNFEVNWLSKTKAQVSAELKKLIDIEPKKSVVAHAQLGIPARLWGYFCDKLEIPAQRKWAEMGKKSIEALSQEICETQYKMNGKTTFKEEFVTAGGISLSEIDPETFALKKIPGLYAAGETLNIDGVTGGFNFQAAWTGAYLAARAISKT